MFKSFVKKFEETTGSIKDKVFNNPPNNLNNSSNNTPVPTTVTTDTTTQSTTNETNPNNPSLTTSTSSSPIYNATVQPVVDALKGTSDVIKGTVVQPMSDVLKDSFKAMDVEALKDMDIPAAFSNMTTTVTNSVTPSNPNLPSIAQIKDSLQDVDLYNGSLLLRSYEIKLKQIRTNGELLAERANETDKKIGPLVKTCMTQADFWKKARDELSKLDELNNMVESISLSMESIVSKIEALEIDLSIEVENYLDNELTKWKEKKESDHIKYETFKKNELIKMEDDLINSFNRHEREKAAKEKLLIQEQEKLERKKKDEELQKKIQEESKLRSTLDKTIQQQLNDYKTNGIIPQAPYTSNISSNVIHNNNSTTTTSIEEILPEDNKEDLEKFLAPTPPLTSQPSTIEEKVEDEKDQPPPVKLDE